MQWERECDLNKNRDTPTGKFQSRENKRKLLNCTDSGLGNDDLPKTEDEFSFYEDQNSVAGFQRHNTDSQDSGCDDILEGVVQHSWLNNEESMDFTNLDVNLKEQLPSDFEMLITGTVSKEFQGSSEFRRSISLNTEVVAANKVHFGKTETVGDFRAAKRPKEDDNENVDLLVHRSLSFNEEHIKDVLQKSLVEPNLIGDFSRPYTLPLTTGRHQDLKCISASTLASLIAGEYSDGPLSYKIIDCRFPYEFDGGHINDAINLYTKDQIMKLLNDCDQLGHVLIFHCEFSSERGPGLCRFLRQMDRKMNEYPQLKYPEMYLLDGGYKGFFEKYINLCEPKAYMPMLHPDHQKDLRYFKNHTKSLSEDNLKSGNRRFKRLGFGHS